MMKLSDEFKTARQNFLDAVTNNEPAEKQGELYEKMLNAILDEAKKSAREEVDGLVAVSPFDDCLFVNVNFSIIWTKKLQKKSKSSSRKKQLTVSLKIWYKNIHCLNILASVTVALV